MTAFFSSGWNGMSTIGDLDRGVTDRLLVTPARRWVLIVGRLGQNAVQVLIQSVVIVGMALAIGVRFEGGAVGVAALLAAVLLGTAFAALSNALALVARQEETLIGAVTFLQLPVDLPVDGVHAGRSAPDWVAAVAKYNPVEWAITAGREAVQAAPTGRSLPGTAASLGRSHWPA